MNQPSPTRRTWHLRLTQGCCLVLVSQGGLDGILAGAGFGMFLGKPLGFARQIKDRAPFRRFAGEVGDFDCEFQVSFHFSTSFHLIQRNGGRCSCSSSQLRRDTAVKPCSRGARVRSPGDRQTETGAPLSSNANTAIALARARAQGGAGRNPAGSRQGNRRSQKLSRLQIDFWERPICQGARWHNLAHLCTGTCVALRSHRELP
jgi:hypothetical protein